MIGYIILTVLKIWYKYQSCLNHSRKRQRSEFGFQPWQGQPHHPPPGSGESFSLSFLREWLAQL